MSVFFSSLEQTFLFLPLVLGTFLSYRILKITDLTVDGTYVLGAVVFARCIDHGVAVATVLSLFSGGLVGVFVAFMQKGNRIGDLIAGVLASFMMFSVNLKVLGRPNISIIGKENILTYLNITNNSWNVVLPAIGVIALTLLIMLLRSKLGLYLRAFGQNQVLLKELGASPEKFRKFGLAISNSLAALTGALTCQVNGFADINMGIGMALIAIGGVVIGRQILGRDDKFMVTREVLSCFLGIFIYFTLLNLLLANNIDPANLKLVLGGFLFIALSKFRRAL